MGEIVLVAEMACAHEGNLESVFKMIEVAANANVDVIQFQFFQTEENVIPGQPNFNLSEQLKLPLEEYSEIFSFSRKNNLKVWATVSDVVSAKESNKYGPEMWRIHSSDINNISLIGYLCKTSIPISFSVGGSTLEEIEHAIRYTRNHGGRVKALIHGFQGYPTPIDEVNLAFIKTLKDKFNITVGYQDHTDGEDVLNFTIPAMAMCYGAEIIEKHFILDRSNKGVDYHSSLNPDELASFVRQMRRVHSAIGCGYGRSFGEFEMKYRKSVKKGFVFRRDLPAGSTISPSDLKMVRLEDLYIFGIEMEKIIGKKLKENVLRDQKVEWRLLQ